MKIYQVDAFAHEPFSGNPAAVCIVEEPQSEQWMQNLAAEMNLSETAFLHRQENGYDLRWFTPTSEVDLCGHATLASAHILWEFGHLDKNETAHFDTKSGRLSAKLKDSWIELNFPSEEDEPTSMPNELIQVLNVKPLYAGKNRMNYLIELESEEVLRNLQPDFDLMLKASSRGVIVTSRSDAEEYDFVSRFFAPLIGINEDPVTGSAHCCTGPYWRKKLGKDELMAYQASKRGGIVKINFENDRVLLSGKAITVLKGEITIST